MMSDACDYCPIVKNGVSGYAAYGTESITKTVKRITHHVDADFGYLPPQRVCVFVYQVSHTSIIYLTSGYVNRQRQINIVLLS